MSRRGKNDNRKTAGGGFFARGNNGTKSVGLGPLLGKNNNRKADSGADIRVGGSTNRKHSTLGGYLQNLLAGDENSKSTNTGGGGADASTEGLEKSEKYVRARELDKPKAMFVVKKAASIFPNTTSAPVAMSQMDSDRARGTNISAKKIPPPPPPGGGSGSSSSSGH